MVHIPTAHKEQVYRHLFKEGCIVVRDESTMKGHEIVKTVDGSPIPNLYVIMLMRSLKSRDFARCTFAWNHSYYFVTETGFEHIRNYLGLPEGSRPAIAERQVEDRPKRRYDGQRNGTRRGNYDRQGGDKPSGDRPQRERSQNRAPRQ